jgi:F-type H+-transporting ATPase subunit epsilon
MTMQLDIVTPDRKVVVGKADDVVIPAKEGEIDVLPGHAPFLAILGTGVLRFVAEGKTHHLMVSGGFVEVDGDRVVLMCESASLKDEVKPEEERKSLHDLEKKLASLGATGSEDESYLKLKAEVDRSAARLTLVK